MRINPRQAVARANLSIGTVPIQALRGSESGRTHSQVRMQSLRSLAVLPVQEISSDTTKSGTGKSKAAPDRRDADGPREPSQGCRPAPGTLSELEVEAGFDQPLVLALVEAIQPRRAVRHVAFGLVRFDEQIHRQHALAEIALVELSLEHQLVEVL
jgi:hypothetical protein